MTNYKRKYEEALERAKQFSEKPYLEDSAGIVEYIFPELKEKRIRKALINGFKDYKGWDEEWFDGITVRDAIAWLEGQGEISPILSNSSNIGKDEQKPTDKIQLGKKYKCIASPRYSTFMIGKMYKPEDKFLCSLMNFCSDCFEPIEDVEQNHSEWSEEDEKTKETIINALYAGTDHAYENEITWLISLKERVQQQLKQEWREEDEQLYNDLSDTYFYNDEDYPEETYKLMLKRVLDWMTKRAKSIRPQSHWKPSDTQMAAIACAVRNMKESACYNSELVSLFDDLKKLKGE